MEYKKNVLKVALENYRHYWRGIPKIGKSTLFRDLLVEAYGDTIYGLLISPGNETGFQALADIIAIETPTWERYVEVVDDLVENKKDNKFKLIAHDTVDELVAIASEKVLKIHQQRKGEKPVSLNAALGGYGQGHKMVQDLINEQIRKLELAGYGLVFISHTKIKDVKEKNMEESYQTLTSNMESRFTDIFANKADIIATFWAEKLVADHKLTDTKRWIYFRTDGFVDAGCRFPGIPERVEMSAKNYLEAFEQGVKSSFSQPVTDKEIEKMKKVELKEKEDKAQQYVEKAQTGSVEDADELKTVGDYRKLINVTLSSLDKDVKSQKREELKEKGIPTKFTEIEDIEILKAILKIVKSE